MATSSSFVRFVACFVGAFALVSCVMSPDADPAGPPSAPDSVVASGGIVADPALIAAITAEPGPPPISGGTLLVTRDGRFAVMSDPALDTIFVVDLEALEGTAIELAPDDEPGRLVEDDAGRVHVVLRRGGAIVTVDPARASMVARRDVCSAPRGIAWRAEDDALVVACAGGELVFLPASGGEATSQVVLDDDLRDVVLDGERILVSRFRAAEILALDSDGTLRERIPLTTIELPLSDRTPDYFEPPRRIPHVAWRMVAAEGGALVLHQRESTTVLETESALGGYGGPSVSAPTDCTGEQRVTTVATFVGDRAEIGASLDLVLGVDVALSANGEELVVATPANAYARSGGPDARSGMLGGVATYDALTVHAPNDSPDPLASEGICATRTTTETPVDGAPTAVAFGPDGRLFIQSHAPAMLTIVGGGATMDVRLANDAPAIGEAIFHARTGSGFACASCHPEGGDDGHVWDFSFIGLRRTQSLRGGVLGTAPFHWDGEFTDFGSLAHDVFEDRMAGGELAAYEVYGLAGWLEGIPALPPIRAAGVTDEAVLRGRALFYSPELLCANCHAGGLLTNNRSVVAGTGDYFQVPSLLGVAHRAPFMHDGCAPTLRARFTDPGCGGGDRHGRTSGLTEGDIDDLVAFLETL